jgi:hypothetical protein
MMPPASGPTSAVFSGSGSMADTSGIGFGANSRPWAISTGATSLRAMITRTPSLVRCQRRTAKSPVSRMQPCEAGWPGSTPSCMATPDQVIRCMYGIGAAL